eukprot:evm.model.NODE_30272_length_18210_cov_22.873146.5
MSGGGGSSSLGPDVWKDLLNWTLKQQEEAPVADPTTIPAAVGIISNDKKEWLEQVMEGTFVDMAKRLRELLDALGKLPGEIEAGKESDITRTTTPSPVAAVEEEGLTTTERSEALWEEVQEHVENLDYALMFCQELVLRFSFGEMEEKEEESSNNSSSTGSKELKLTSSSTSHYVFLLLLCDRAKTHACMAKLSSFFRPC